MGITITPKMFLLIDLMLENFIRELLAEVSNMTPEEVAAKTAAAEEKSKRLREELKTA